MISFPSVYLVGSGQLGFDLTNKYDCNVYLIDGGGEIALIDVGSGMQPDRIVKEIKKSGYTPKDVTHILITHYHADHCGGLHYMREVTNASVYASSESGKAIMEGNIKDMGLVAARAHGIYPETYDFVPSVVDHLIKERDQIRIGRLLVTVMETPGHCKGHLSFTVSIEDRQCLFSGDAIFHGGKISIQDIPDCSLQEYSKTTRTLGQLSIDALFPGHGMFSLHEAQRHIDLANAEFDRLRIPANIT